jgi:tetratricopeptide (TPR) repeat protein
MNRAQYYLEKPYGALMLDEFEAYREIIDGLSECIRNNKSAGVAYHNRALAYWEIGEIENALHDFAEAEKALPNSHMTSQLKGMLLQKLGRLDEAIESMNRAVEISPNEATVRRARAHLLLKAERLDASLMDFDHAVELDPAFQRTREDRDKVLALLGRTDQERDNSSG